MTFTRIGGLLVIAAASLLTVTLVIALGGASVSVGGDGPGSATVTAALVLLGAGLLVLAIVGPPPFGGRLVRTGFATVAVGGAVELASARATADSMLVFAFLLGGLAVLVGLIISGIGLLRMPGRPRWVGLMFIAGIALALVAGAVANDPGVAFSTDAAGLRAAMSVTAMVAAGLMLAALAAIGLLAWVGEPGAAVAADPLSAE
jgi:hypothetical protein